MKRFSLLIFILIAVQGFSQVNPFEEFNYEPEFLTLSKGEYQEFFGQDSIVQIGHSLFNTRTNKVVGFVEYDTIMPEYGAPEIVSRWLSPDPLASKYPSWSPYNFVKGNPIYYVDPDGQDVFAHGTKSQKLVLKSFRKTFGRKFTKNNFSFNGNKLAFSGSLSNQGTPGNGLSNKQNYVLNRVVTDLVDNSDVNLRIGAQFKGTLPTGTVVNNVNGEVTQLVTDPTTGKSTGVILVNQPVKVDAVGGGQTTADKSDLVLHGIGHVLTNLDNNVSDDAASPNRPQAQKETVGFENLVRDIRGQKQRTGTDHGISTVPGSSGTDNSVIQKAQNFVK